MELQKHQVEIQTALSVISLEETHHLGNVQGGSYALIQDVSIAIQHSTIPKGHIAGVVLALYQDIHLGSISTLGRRGPCCWHLQIL